MVPILILLVISFLAGALPTSTALKLGSVGSILGNGVQGAKALVKARPMPSLVAAFATGYAIGAVVGPALERYDTAGDVPARLFRKKAVLKARVIKVADGDTFRVAHVPMFSWFRGAVKKLVKNEHKQKLSESTIQVRIAAVDCPETAKFGSAGQRYGNEAKEFVQQLLEGRTVRIKLLQRDQYQRAVCSVNYGWGFGRRDISEELLKRGLAVVYRQSGGQYDGPIERWNRLEADAQQKRIGMWKEGGVDPASYKRSLREGKSA